MRLSDDAMVRESSRLLLSFFSVYIFNIYFKKRKEVDVIGKI